MQSFYQKLLKVFWPESVRYCLLLKVSFESILIIFRKCGILSLIEGIFLKYFDYIPKVSDIVCLCLFTRISWKYLLNVSFQSILIIFRKYGILSTSSPKARQRSLSGFPHCVSFLFPQDFFILCREKEIQVFHMSLDKYVPIRLRSYSLSTDNLSKNNFPRSSSPFH